MVVRRLLAALVLLLANACPSGALVYAKHENPRLVVTPRMGIVSPGRPIRALALVLFEDPGADWYCPEVTFQWAEGYASSIASDCLPYEQVSESDRKWFRASRSMNYGAGDHTITVILAQGTKRKQLSETVSYR